MSIVARSSPVSFIDEFKTAVADVLRAELPRILRETSPSTVAERRPTCSVAEAAKVACRHPDTVRRAIKAGELRAFHPLGAREWVIESADLDRWLQRVPASNVVDLDLEARKALDRARERRGA